MMSARLNALIWDSGVSYERQPLGITIFTMVIARRGRPYTVHQHGRVVRPLQLLIKDLIQNLKLFTMSKRLPSVYASKGG